MRCGARRGLLGLDHAAGHARPGIARGLGREVVGSGVDDDAAVQNVARAFGQGDAVHEGHEAGLAIGSGHEHGQVAGVVVRPGRVAVVFAKGIEVPAGAGAVHGAAIALFMDVETVRAGGQTGELTADLHLVALLLKGHGSGSRAALGGLEHAFGAGAFGCASCKKEHGERKHEKLTHDSSSMGVGDYTKISYHLHLKGQALVLELSAVRGGSAACLAVLHATAGSSGRKPLNRRGRMSAGGQSWGSVVCSRVGLSRKEVSR